nr:M15 family metallopeptidase [Paenibacillus shirakamiensis]
MLVTGCGNESKLASSSSSAITDPAPAPNDDAQGETPSSGSSGTVAAIKNPSKPSKDKPSQQAWADPKSEMVLVNKKFALPDGYVPTDLVYPNVPFTFKEKIEKRKMRKEAASALEKLFAAAKKDKIYLAGVSAYRSEQTQIALFNRYVKRDGEAKAKTYSAVPGHSEHQTGLAIDVSGSNGRCAAEDCFGGTPEAKWLAAHVADYGFVIRYPKGKDSVTGYKYEPWHIRYVGEDIAKTVMSQGITLEEYYEVIPVSGK